MEMLLNTLIIVAVFKTAEFLIEVAKKRYVAEQTKKGEIDAQIDLEPKLHHLLQEVESMFNSKLEHLKGYIDASKHINIKKIDEDNDVIKEFKTSVYSFVVYAIDRTIPYYKFDLVDLQKYESEFTNARIKYIYQVRRLELIIDNEEVVNTAKKMILDLELMYIELHKFTAKVYEFVNDNYVNDTMDFIKPFEENERFYSRLTILHKQFNSACLIHLKSLLDKEAN